MDDRWTIYLEDDSGGLEVGDRGQIRYDPQGRWLQALNHGTGELRWWNHPWVARVYGASPRPAERRKHRPPSHSDRAGTTRLPT